MSVVTRKIFIECLETEARNKINSVKFSTGVVYHGNNHFHKDRSEFGEYVWPDGQQFSGNFDKGLKSGDGKQSWYGEERHVGQYHENYKHGYGVYTFVNGDTYKGAFYYDKKHGFGEYQWANGDLYRGTFYLNKREGFGVMKYAESGHLFEGLYKEGQRQGPGVLTYPDGRQDVGFWRGSLLYRLIVPMKHGCGFSLAKQLPEYAAMVSEKFTVKKERVTQQSLKEKQLVRDENLSALLGYIINPPPEFDYDTRASSRLKETIHEEVLERSASANSIAFNKLEADDGFEKEASAVKSDALLSIGEHQINSSEQLHEQQHEPQQTMLPTQPPLEMTIWNLTPAVITMQQHLCNYSHWRPPPTDTCDYDALLSLDRSRFGPAGPGELSAMQFLDDCHHGKIAEIRRALLSGLILPEVTDCEGRFGLLEAALTWQTDIVNLLLDYGGNPNQVNDEQMSTLAACFVYYYPLNSSSAKNDVIGGQDEAKKSADKLGRTNLIKANEQDEPNDEEPTFPPNSAEMEILLQQTPVNSAAVLAAENQQRLAAAAAAKKKTPQKSGTANSENTDNEDGEAGHEDETAAADHPPAEATMTTLGGTTLSGMSGADESGLGGRKAVNTVTAVSMSPGGGNADAVSSPSESEASIPSPQHSRKAKQKKKAASSKSGAAAGGNTTTPTSKFHGSLNLLAALDDSSSSSHYRNNPRKTQQRRGDRSVSPDKHQALSFEIDTTAYDEMMSELASESQLYTQDKLVTGNNMKTSSIIVEKNFRGNKAPHVVPVTSSIAAHKAVKTTKKKQKSGESPTNATDDQQLQEEQQQQLMTMSMTSLQSSQEFDSNRPNANYPVEINRGLITKAATQLATNHMAVGREPRATSANQKLSRLEGPARHLALKMSRRVQMLRMIELLLQRGADPNVCYVPMPALFFAVKAGDVAMVQLLLSKGIDVNISLPDERGALYPLHLAVGLDGEKSVQIAEMLLFALADPNCRAVPDKSFLDNNFIDDWSKDQLSAEQIARIGGKTPLHLAAVKDYDYKNATKIVQLLLKHRADPNLLCNGHSPLSLAVASGNDSVIEELLQYSSTDPNLALCNGLGSALCVVASTVYEHRRPVDKRIQLINRMVACGADMLHPAVPIGHKRQLGTAVDYAYFVFNLDRRIAHLPFHALTPEERETFNARRTLLNHLGVVMRDSVRRKMEALEAATTSATTEQNQFVGGGGGGAGNSPNGANLANMFADVFSSPFTVHLGNTTTTAMKHGSKSSNSSRTKSKTGDTPSHHPGAAASGAASAALDTSKRLYKYCYECGRIVGVRLSPCTRCKQVFFCSKICKTKSWNTLHKFECVRAGTVRESSAKSKKAGSNVYDDDVPDLSRFNVEDILRLTMLNKAKNPMRNRAGSAHNLFQGKLPPLKDFRTHPPAYSFVQMRNQHIRIDSRGNPLALNSSFRAPQDNYSFN